MGKGRRGWATPGQKSRAEVRWELARELTQEPLLGEVMSYLGEQGGQTTRTVESYLQERGVGSRSTAYRMIQRWTNKGLLRKGKGGHPEELTVGRAVERQFKQVSRFFHLPYGRREEVREEKEEEGLAMDSYLLDTATDESLIG